MRWILVFLFLYLIPLIVLFRNYNNFKRSCLYSSIYIVLVSTIVITNIYMSGLNKIKEAMYYQNYALEERSKEKYASNFDKNEKEDEDISDNDIDIKQNQESESTKIAKSDNKVKEDSTSVENGKTEEIVDITKEKDDKEIILEFKKEIYDIESIALVPMRDCMPYTKNISENLKNLENVGEDVKYAQKMCREVITMYDDMEIPYLSKDEYTQVLHSAKNDVKKAYELREKAMESAATLIDTKNPKYIGQITQYLNLSDKHITSFKERLSDLNDKIL